MPTILHDESHSAFDLVVIGAGIYGIQAARTYLELHPGKRVAVFEACDDIGGVWSSERVYDGFWTQTPLRILAFSDVPLEGVPKSDTYHDFFPAKYVTQYLKSYIKVKAFNGTSLASRIHLHSTVEVVEKIEGGWNLFVRSQGKTAEEVMQITASKIIDASGLTSQPNIPSFPGSENFKGLVIHSKEFCHHQNTILQSKESQAIIVVGGAKSAADVAYVCAKAGHSVNWVVRRSGAGPAAFVSAKGRGPYKNSNESFYTRFTSHLLVSYFLDESKTWLGRFLYKTRLGRRFIQSTWKSINNKAHAVADYDREDGKENGFFNLKPDTDIFWQNDSTGICQRKDFFDVIAQRVRVYREDIKTMTADGLDLADGTTVHADIVILATGWKASNPKIRLSEGGVDLMPPLGLSVSTSTQPAASMNRWAGLEEAARQYVLNRFPLLRKHPPHFQDAQTNATPLRLYKGILPINDRNIAFVGQMMLGNNFRAAEVQALYAVAALDGALCLPSTQRMETKVAEMAAWNRLRYLAKGRFANWLYWDMVPYTDDLLQELGLTSHRHRSYWKDMFAPCYASDLRGLIDEYRVKYGTS